MDVPYKKKKRKKEKNEVEFLPHNHMPYKHTKYSKWIIGLNPRDKPKTVLEETERKVLLILG